MKTFIITGFIVLVLTIIFVLLWCNLGLENTYFIFSSLGAVATVIAIYVAISMPEKIADQQNKIALFEKRYELYTTYSIFIKLGKVAYNVLKSSSNILDKYELGVLLMNNLIPTKYKEELIDSGDEKLNKMLSIVHQLNNYTLEFEKIRYLFILDESEETMLKEIILILDDFPYDISDPKIDFKNFRYRQLKLIRFIRDATILTTMEKQLQLSSEVK